MAAPVLSFDGFCARVRAELDLEVPLTRDTRLREDLDLDSLGILLVALLVEELGSGGEGVTAGEVDTIGELYTACVAGVIGGTVCAPDGFAGRDHG